MVLKEKNIQLCFVSLATVTFVSWGAGQGHVCLFSFSPKLGRDLREPLGTVRVPHANTQSSELRSQGRTPQ